MEQVTISQFLLRRLKEAGCNDIFGVPGDFVLGFFNQILKSDVNYVGTCNELNAAYAADAYARLNGIGCVSTTYAVGELSGINGVAGSFAESVPVVKITGTPATKFYRDRPLLHHTIGDYDSPLKMYSHVTVAQTMLNNPETAVSEIDRVLTACLKRKAPVYIGLPSDMVLRMIDAPIAPFVHPQESKSDPGALDEAVLETLRLLHQCRRPIFIPGIEISRRRLQADFEKLLNASGIPFTTMMLAKSIFNEDHKQFIGLYCGDRSRPYVQQRVEGADCVVIFGERLTDFNTGGFSANMDRRSTIEVTYDCVRIMFHAYNNVYIHDFVRELAARISFRVPKNLDMKPAIEGCVHRRTVDFKADNEKNLTMARFFDRMSHFLQSGSVVIAETGASLFSAAEVLMPKGTTFIGQTFYGSIGYTVGATLGACIAAPHRPVYLFIGDGSFQVTCQDLSTMIRYGCKPTVFLVNNDGYTIERVIVDRKYNDIQPWKYHKLCDVFGGGKSYDVHNEGQLEEALKETCQNNQMLNFIEIHLDRWDCNDALRRAGHAMAVNNRLLDEDELKNSTGSCFAVNEENDLKRCADVVPHYSE
ncbi:uncharacterized protein LOC129617514 [Condylostylus longicornis]|uniref:uncharacterized protein LOC129617514 n=1 Tax=Condylostylus longicornis TaxID=2530218 RepID=UPI00244DE825|nr:uncharacterized protein LOC129617514 [Condylostylus longicornis]